MLAWLRPSRFQAEHRWTQAGDTSIMPSVFGCLQWTKETALWLCLLPGSMSLWPCKDAKKSRDRIIACPECQKLADNDVSKFHQHFMSMRWWRQYVPIDPLPSKRPRFFIGTVVRSPLPSTAWPTVNELFFNYRTSNLFCIQCKRGLISSGLTSG